jgi:hypothetical protein
MENAKNRDEIDLMELFLKGVNVIRANFWLVVVFFCIGLVLGFIFYSTSTRIYEAKMVIASGILTSSYSKNLIEKLNTHRRENNQAAMKALLNVSDEVVQKFSYADIDPLSKADELKETDRFIITARVLDRKIFPELQKGLVQYLENNEFVKIRVEQNKNYYQQMLAKIDSEIKDMEEFKQRIINGQFFQSAKGNVMFDPTTVNSKILELTKERINLQNSLALANSVQVIEGFTPFERPVSPKLSISLASGAVLGVVGASIVLFIKTIRRLLKFVDASNTNT